MTFLGLHHLCQITHRLLGLGHLIKPRVRPRPVGEEEHCTEETSPGAEGVRKIRLHRATSAKDLTQDLKGTKPPQKYELESRSGHGNAPTDGVKQLSPGEEQNA